jgi:tetratricopeptide (TPR) repeat protein
VQLKPTGLSWQSFARIVRRRLDLGIPWYKDDLAWNEFALSVVSLIDGHIEQDGMESTAKKPTPVDLAQWQIPPLREWEKFERLCLDLWKEIWRDPKAQRVGRSGQSQRGVDIVGTPAANGRSPGIQCKKKDVTYAGDTLTKEDIHHIVDQAKPFTPPLSELTIAYIGKRDAALQEEARRVTAEHRMLGLFSVHLSSWDDILESLGDHQRVFHKHFPQFAGINIDQAELNRRIDAPQELSGKSETLSAAGNLPFVAKDFAKEVAQAAADSVAVSGEHDAEIDHARDLLQALKPKEALDYLEKLEKRIWFSANRLARFRILANKASALASLGRNEDAGRLFIEAHQYNPDDEKALCNRASGHLLLDQVPQAEEFARKVLAKNPAGTRAYGILINCARPNEPLEQIIQSIPAELRKKEDVAFAIAHAARQRNDLESTIQWLRVSLEDARKGNKKNPDLLCNLASTTLEAFTKKQGMLSGVQLTPEDREKICEAATFLTEAIEAISSETLPYRLTWITNRSIAYMLIDQIDRAVADMETAARLKPNDGKRPVFDAW